MASTHETLKIDNGNWTVIVRIDGLDNVVDGVTGIGQRGGNLILTKAGQQITYNKRHWMTITRIDEAGEAE